MATALALPEGYAPSNLHLAPSVQVRMVDGDMFDICKRLAHVSRSLFIVQLTDRKGKHCNYVIMERGIDGGAYMVLKTTELDARVIERVEYLLRVPFDKRFEEAERLEAEAVRQMEQNAIDEAVEKVAHGFQRQLWHDGFVEHRKKSYPTRGVAQPGRHR